MGEPAPKALAGLLCHRGLLLLSITLVVCPMQAILLEHSASANSLSGITLLSSSPSDYALSPIIGSTGVCANWIMPFGISEASVYGLHTAFLAFSPVVVATGINYRNHPDYRWQDEYLSVSAVFPSIKIGATQHLIYEKIADQSWLAWDNDFALAVFSDSYATEVRYNSCFSEDAALSVSANSLVNKSTNLCSAYTWRKHDKGSYAFAASYKLAKPLIISSSWQSEPARFGMGMNIIIGKLSLLYAIRTHPELNLSHSLDIGSAW